MRKIGRITKIDDKYQKYMTENPVLSAAEDLRMIGVTVCMEEVIF